MKFNSCKKEERKTSTVCDLHDRNQILNGKMKPLWLEITFQGEHNYNSGKAWQGIIWFYLADIDIF